MCSVCKLGSAWPRDGFHFIFCKHFTTEYRAFRDAIALCISSYPRKTSWQNAQTSGNAVAQAAASPRKSELARKRCSVQLWAGVSKEALLLFQPMATQLALQERKRKTCGQEPPKPQTKLLRDQPMAKVLMHRVHQQTIYSDPGLQFFRRKN